MTIALYTTYIILTLALGFVAGWKLRGEYEAYEPIKEDELNIYE